MKKIQIIRNFGMSSWMYSEQMRSNKNKNMRHVGSRNTLKEDLEFMKNDKDHVLYKAQIIHDLLVSTCIYQYLQSPSH